MHARPVAVAAAAAVTTAIAAGPAVTAVTAPLTAPLTAALAPAAVTAATPTGDPQYAPQAAANTAVAALHTGGRPFHAARIAASPTARPPGMQVGRALKAGRLCGSRLPAAAG